LISFISRIISTCATKGLTRKIHGKVHDPIETTKMNQGERKKCGWFFENIESSAVYERITAVLLLATSIENY